MANLCAVPTCDKPRASRGWCQGHYLRWKVHGDVDADRPLGVKRPQGSIQCSVENETGRCANSARARGWCQGHYQRWKKNGTPGAVALRRPQYRSVMSNGYVRVWCPGHPMANSDGYALEHRKVAYDVGLAVASGDHVHHINGNKRDNRPENLEVKRAGDHHRDHIAEAGFVVNQYGTWTLRRNRSDVQRRAA